MCNLVKNHSFEVGLSEWIVQNVTAADITSFIGTQTARMGSGIASIYQDVSLKGVSSRIFFLSYEILVPGTALGIGNLIVEVIWLDAEGRPIGQGLNNYVQGSLLIASGRRLTYFNITDPAPSEAESARIQFSKNSFPTAQTDQIEIDQVVFGPVDSFNLLQNPGFELHGNFWDDTAVVYTLGSQVFEGTGFAELLSNGPASVSQDIPLDGLPKNSSFLLSFAVRGLLSGPPPTYGDLMVEVQWLDSNNIPLGLGLSLTIRNDTLILNDRFWSTYLAVTTPAPNGATTARVVFRQERSDNTTGIGIDNVMFIRTESTNLLANPSFEIGLNEWNSVNYMTGDNPFEGVFSARAFDRGYIFQDVNIGNSAGCCFLLSFAVSGVDGTLDIDFRAEVHWLDAQGRDLGLGLSLVVNDTGPQESDRYSTVVALTEPAPKEAVQARIQFTNATEGAPSIDLVTFTKLFCPPSPPPQVTRGVRTGLNTK